MPNLLQNFFRPSAVSLLDRSVRLKKSFHADRIDSSAKASNSTKTAQNRTFGHGTRLGFQPAAGILHYAGGRREKAETRFKMRHTNLPITWRSLTAATIAVSLLLGILVSGRAQAQVNEPAAPTALARYTRNITAAAEQGKFDSFSDQAKETSRALAILAERNNPVLLTDSQAERNVVIAGVARQIVRGQGPEELIGRRVLKLDLDKLFQDTKNAEQLKTTLTAVLSEIENSDPKVIIVIDPIHTLVGTSAAFDATVSEFVREAIAGGKFQCIGASTQGTFKDAIAGDEKLASLFTAIEITETTSETKNEEASAETADTEEFTGEKIS